MQGVSLDVLPNRTVALVGESGSGKTVISQAILGILPRNAPITGGSICFADPRKRRRAASTSPPCRPDSPERRAIRGDRISIIFQEPMSSLSPLHTIGDQIGEALRIHDGADAEAHARARSRCWARSASRSPRQAVDRYPVRALGRPAAAGDDRHGADLPARRC